MTRLTLAALIFLATSGFGAVPGPRRALLIGINDYSTTAPSTIPDRDWSNLEGAVNDVELMRDLLIARGDVAPADILVLTDKGASRDAILRAIEDHLLRPAKKGDTLLFYYSGHGSQVKNTRSSEADKLDESLVPADSRAGAEDIRDKELSEVFNCILDHGARLTVVIDACHSASGARGLEGGPRHRGVTPDLRDVADPSTTSRPEDRGALVIAAAEDFDLAYETLGDGKMRGAFSWAFARALRDGELGEAVGDTFVRAQARLRSEMPSQNPILAGRADARLAPFLGAPGERAKARPGIAIERVASDGTCSLLGGWVHGLTVGTKVRVAGTDEGELEITSLIGAGRAEARPVPTGTRRAGRGSAPAPGDLLEINSWVAPPLRKLQVWVPSAPEPAITDAPRLVREAIACGMHPIDDPTDVTPAILWRWRKGAWEHIGNVRHPTDATLFVQVPAPSSLADALGEIEGIEFVSGPDSADYILTGRIGTAGVEYAWVRPRVTAAADAARSPMPLRTQWTAFDSGTASVLRAALQRLIRVHGWHELQSPAGGGSAYRLAIRDARSQSLVENRSLVGNQEYQLVLRLRDSRTPVHARYVYAFIIDSNGRCVLLFPRAQRGSVENRLPATESAAQPVADPPAEIPLSESTFVVTPPYGIDTYFLLSTGTPLSSTFALEWEGVRTVPRAPRSALEMLLAQAASGTRGDPVQTPPNWSIEKVFFESIPPGRASP